jgi:BirA family biotin operon repressor/biotin-[acetyl-CoA-carboxylase] ligase
MAEDTLSPGLITTNLTTRFIGQKVIYHPRLTSTMALARQAARQGAAEGTVVVADEQTAGKGRLKRLWLSPVGSIALSIILYPDMSYLPCLMMLASLAVVHSIEAILMMLASLAVVHSIEAITGLKAQLKWPNDVLIDDKKVCGILIESDLRGNTVDYAIIGIGINVNFRLTDFPEILPHATSLADEVKKEISRVAVIRHLLIETEKLYLALPDGDPIYFEWQDKLVTLGRKVQVESGETFLTGIAESVARDGSLLLRHSDGSVTSVVAGDVTLRDYK